MTSWFRQVFGRANAASTSRDDLGEQNLMPVEGEDDGGQLAVDVYQDKDNVVIKSTIAGVRPEDLDITIGGDQVTIRGERHQEQEVAEQDYFYQECYWGAFSRSLALPVEIDVEKAVAELRDGILTITLPKAARSRTKKVKVKGSV